MTDIISVLPKDFGLVVLATMGSYVATIMIGGKVMKGRKQYGVEYPNMYASVVETADGKVLTNAKDEKSAEKFNCIQRGHQNALENHYAIMVLTVLGGLAMPKVAAGSLGLWTAGAYLYAVNYCEGGPKNRNGGIAKIKYIGLLGLLVCNGYFSFLLLNK